MFLRPPPEWLPRMRRSKWNLRRHSLALDKPSVGHGNAVGAFSVPGATVTNTAPVGAADTRDNWRWRDCLRSPSPRRERRGCGRRRGGRGGDVQCDRRHALLIGAVAEDVAQVVGIMTNADAVAAVVMRADEGGVGVAAFGAPATASRKTTNGLRCSSAPWRTTWCVSLGPRRTDTRSTPSSS